MQIKKLTDKSDCVTFFIKLESKNEIEAFHSIFNYVPVCDFLRKYGDIEPVNIRHEFLDGYNKEMLDNLIKIVRDNINGRR